MINWRDPEEELPSSSDGVSFCIILCRFEDGSLKIRENYYWEDEKIWSWGYEDDVIAWCYIDELINTVPNKFKG